VSGHWPAVCDDARGSLQHLKVLRNAGFVSAIREGYYVHYRVNEGALTLSSPCIARPFERLRAGSSAE